MQEEHKLGRQIILGHCCPYLLNKNDDHRFNWQIYCRRHADVVLGGTGGAVAILLKRRKDKKKREKVVKTEQTISMGPSVMAPCTML